MRRVIGAAAGAMVLAGLLVPAAEAAQVRAFGARLDGKSFVLTVDGKATHSVANGRATARFTVKAGTHVFLARSLKRTVLARLTVRITANGLATVALADTANGKPRLVFVPEGPTSSGVATVRVADLAARAGLVDVQLGSPGLVLARHLSFGRTTVVRGVATNASTSGWIAVAVRRAAGAGLVATARLPVAPGTTTTYLLVPQRAGSLLRPLPTPIAVPFAIVQPAVSGHLRLGQVLSCTRGVWANARTYAYQWLRDGVAIAGATGTTHQLVSLDAGSVVDCRVTAANGSVAVRASAGVFLIAVPQNLVAPDISADAGNTEGSTLTCGVGSWLYTPESYSVAWYRAGSTAPFAGGSTYVLNAPGDNGVAISCAVTATNAGGTAGAAPSSTSITLGQRPVNVTLPTVSGTAALGGTLTCSSAPSSDWSNLPNQLSFQWLRNGAPIGAATARTTPPFSSNYQLVLADDAHSVSCRVTARNSFGLSDPATAPQIVNLPHIPVLSTVTITGAHALGEVLTPHATLAGASGAVATYDVTWSGTTPTSCSGIVNPTTCTYTVVAGDSGNNITVSITARNLGGTDTDSSANFPIPGVPVIGTAPTLGGVPAVGNDAHLNTIGSWSNTPTTYTVDWLHGMTVVAGTGQCTGTSAEVRDATNGCKYAITTADDGLTISARVTAHGPGGDSLPAVSSNNISIPNPPTNSTPPSVSGAAAINTALTVVVGGWSPSPTSYAVTWLADGGVAPAGTPTGTCTGTVATVSSCTYTTLPADAGHTIFARVVASDNGGDSLPADSVGLEIPAPPANIAVPTIDASGAPTIVLLSPGSWTVAVTSYAVTWLVNGNPAGTCSDVSSCQVDASALVSGDTLVARVTATNGGGASEPADSLPYVAP